MSCWLLPNGRHPSQIHGRCQKERRTAVPPHHRISKNTAVVLLWRMAYTLITLMIAKNFYASHVESPQIGL